MDNESQQVPPIPNKPEIKTAKNLSFAKTLSYGFVIVSVGVSIAIGGYLLGVSKTKPQPAIQTSATPVVSPTPDPTANWQTYTIKSLGLVYKLPSAIAALGELQEFINPGQVGTQILISTENSKVISDKKFLMGTTSINYVEGRGGMFIDMQGFIKKDGKYYAKFVDSKTYEIPGSSVSEIINTSGLQMIKIIGRNHEGDGYPLEGTPGKGKIGALINVAKQSYQGLAVQMDLTPTLTEQLFDQILSTFKFTGQNQTTTASWKTYSNTLGGFTLKYPADWITQGYEGVNNNFSSNSDVIRFYSKSPSKDAINGDYMCVEFRIDSTDNFLLKNGSTIATLDNGLTLYQSRDNFSEKDMASLRLTKNGNSIVDLPNGKKLLSSSSFNCVQGDLSSIRLNYDQQLQSSEYKQAIEILKSISF